MTDVKHTPGPWTVSETTHPTLGFWSVRGGNAELSLGPIHEKADAQLIAAAPDLLGALKKAHDLLTTDCTTYATGSPLDGEISKAIDKAEGNESS